MDRFIRKREDFVFVSVVPGECVVVLGWSSARVCKTLGISSIYIGTDVLRSQQNTERLFEFIKHGKVDVVLDDAAVLKNDLSGFRWIRDNRKNYKSRIFIPCETGKFNLTDYDKVVEPGGREPPTDGENMDLFHEDTGDYIREIITTEGKFDFETHMKIHVHEPGNRMGIIHSNYTETKGATMEEIAEISDCMSQGDVYDNIMYSSLYTDITHVCFVAQSILKPALIIKNRIPFKKIKPATAWTKHFNMCLKKSQEIYWKVSDPDTLHALRHLTEYIPEYCKHSKGIHFINHSGMGNKIDIKKYKEILKKREQDNVEQL